MIIDFHTHMFPDKIAGRTLDYLSGIFGASPFADGTYTGLCNSMGKGAVDISIALPAVTKISQVAAINRFASAYTEGPVISFGGIHPECENYKEILKEIKNLGLKGIKLHPDYQDMYFDNIRYERIIGAASELGLITVVHAGVDPKCPEDVHCTPEMARKMMWNGIWWDRTYILIQESYWIQCRRNSSYGSYICMVQTGFCLEQILRGQIRRILWRC